VKKFSNLIHIGLGKTATTTMQEYVYPFICKIRPEIKFNDARLQKNIRIFHYCGGNDYLKISKEILANENCLISDESLCNWNPVFWEYSAVKNLEIFGPNAQIIITVRKTEEYLTSIYLQTLHEGNVKLPSSFFVSAEQAKILDGWTSRNSLSYFDVDSFNLIWLKKIYEERFKNVCLVPMHELQNLEFIARHYCLSDNELIKIKECFKNAPKKNISYSDIAVKLTLKREKIINKIGLKTNGSNDKAWLIFLKTHKNMASFEEKKNSILLRDLCVSQKILRTPECGYRILNYLMRKLLNWRFIMQHIVNNIFPYKKYVLPADVYRNASLAEKNDFLVQNLKS
jgi:hypothetical protein